MGEVSELPFKMNFRNGGSSRDWVVLSGFLLAYILINVVMGIAWFVQLIDVSDRVGGQLSVTLPILMVGINVAAIFVGLYSMARKRLS